jgi:flagellar hook-associated protein 3 FlgL
MRVSQSILTNTTLSNLNQNLEVMLGIQEKLSTGREINKATDGPVRFSQALTLRSAIDINTQHKKNAEFAVKWLNSTDKAIGEASEVLQRVRELTVRASSDTMGLDERSAIANEIDELNKQMRQIANSDLQGRYIFAGADTQREPYKDPSTVVDPSLLPPNDGTNMKVEIGKAVTIQFNTLGTDAFGRNVPNAGDPKNVFQVMTDLSTALRANDQQAIAAMLPQIDQRHQAFLTAQSVVGGKVNRLNLLTSRISDQNVELAKSRSETEDADMTRLITDLNRQDAVYRASLAAGSRVIQPTLQDYLR